MEPRTYDFQYDAVDQLLSAKLALANSPFTILNSQFFNYDHAGNRMSEQISEPSSHPTIQRSSYNNLNQLVSQQAGGPMQFKGHLSKPSKVTISNGTITVPATVDANNVFQGSVDVVPGTNTVSIVAVDYTPNRNTTTNRSQIAVAADVDRGFTYDANGNLSQDDKYKYDWNAANRCMAINEIGGTHHTEFTYDGLSRMVRLVEKDGATITRDSHFVWVGTEMAEERDANGNVLKRFYDWGFQSFNIQLSTFNSFYYLRDHLGSIVAVVDSSGVVRARYTYDLYGKRSANLITVNSVEADFGFTGYYHYQPTWMPDAHLLAMYRIYRPDLAQWISNDLLEFEDPLNNERRYVRGNPINRIDPLGLWSPGGHDFLFENAFRGRLGRGQTEAFKRGSRAFDERTGLEAEDAPKHSMRRPNQNPSDAIKERNQFIRDRIKHAALQYHYSGDLDLASDTLSEAFHAGQDSTSPEHVDECGQPKRWDGVVMGSANTSAFGHSINDQLGNETVFDITPAILERNNRLMNTLYDMFEQEVQKLK